MGGVDRADQLLSFYRNEMKTKNWYKIIIFHLMDIAAENSWLLYCVKDSEIQLAEFKLQVAFGLMKSEKSHEAPLQDRTLTENVLSNRALDVPTSVRYDGVSHVLVKVLQKSAPRCKLPQCAQRTRLQCKKCKVYLCIEEDGPANCFERFHNSVFLAYTCVRSFSSINKVH